jgi:hypothetical protein
MHDLIIHGIIDVNETGRISGDLKINGEELKKAAVRFRVYNSNNEFSQLGTQMHIAAIYGLMKQCTRVL